MNQHIIAEAWFNKLFLAHSIDLCTLSINNLLSFLSLGMSKTPDCLYLIRNVSRWQEHMAQKTSHRRHRAKVLVEVEM